MKITRNYLVDFLKSKLIFVSLLITALALSFMLAGSDFGLRETVFNQPKLVNFVVISTCLYVAIMFVFMMSKIACNKINIVDAISLSIFLVGVIYLVNLIITKTFASNHRLMFLLVHIAFGGWYLVTRFFVYRKKYINTNARKTNIIKQYYQELFKKFKFLPLVLFSLFLSCIICLLSYTPNGQILNEIPYYVVGILCFLPIIIGCIANVKSNTITFADGFVFSSLIQSPVVFAFLFYVNFSPIFVSIWSVVFALMLVFMLFRLIMFTPNATKKRKIDKSNYIKLLFSLYTPYSILGMGALMALSLMLICKTNVVSVLINGATLNIYSFFGLVLGLFLLALTITLIVLTYYGRDDEETHLVDFGILILTVFSICGFITLFINISLTAVIAMTVIMLYTLLMLRYRSRMFETLD